MPFCSLKVFDPYILKSRISKPTEKIENLKFDNEIGKEPIFNAPLMTWRSFQFSSGLTRDDGAVDTSHSRLVFVDRAVVFKLFLVNPE